MQDFKYGLFFPVLLDAGKPVPPGLFDSIDSSLRVIFTWVFNTRNFTPTFGALIHSLLGSPLSDSTVESIEVYTRLAIRQWERRIELTSLTIDRDNENGSLHLKVEAVVKNLGIQYNYQVIL